MLSACGLVISLSVNGEIDDCVDDIRWNQIADLVPGAGRYEIAEAATHYQPLLSTTSGMGRRMLLQIHLLAGIGTRRGACHAPGSDTLVR